MGTIVKTQARQGDVYILRADYTLGSDLGETEVAREDGRLILAHGEATGHAHAVADEDTRMFKSSYLNKVFLSNANVAEIVHDEHSAIALEPGIWEVRRQREFDERELVRQVAD